MYRTNLDVDVFDDIICVMLLLNMVNCTGGPLIRLVCIMLVSGSYVLLVFARIISE